jgi:tripartite-type tricarboxylate transporter receptor subunit TctC
MRAIITSDEISKRIVADGGDPAPATPDEYAAQIARDEAKWSDLIKKIGLVIN